VSCQLKFTTVHLRFPLGNAKVPSILNQMIQEAHEIRENQSYRNISSTANIVGVRQNITEESVSSHMKLISILLIFFSFSG
jgi:hypothetical protein